MYMIYDGTYSKKNDRKIKKTRKEQLSRKIKTLIKKIVKDDDDHELDFQMGAELNKVNFKILAPDQPGTNRAIEDKEARRRPVLTDVNSIIECLIEHADSLEPIRMIT